HYQTKQTFDLFDADIMLGVNKDLTDKISTNSVVGANTQKQTFEALSAQGDNYVVIGLEDINNTTNPLPVYSFWEKKKNSVYGSFELSWDKWAYLTYTGRNEWFSSLSFPGKTTPNSDYYWSLSGSALLNDAFNMGDAVSYLKLRSSYAQVAGDTGAYQLNLDYSVLGTFLGQAFGQINGSTIPNPDLVPLQKNEFEVGLEGRFFSNRLNIDLAYYANETTNDIVRATATPTSGYLGAMLNVGELQNKGFELLIGGYPIRNDDFSWNISYNLGYNDSEIVATNEDANPITMTGSRSETAYIEHQVGEDYGTIVGFGFKRDDAGNIVYSIDGNGVPRPEQGEYMILGQGVAPLTMGLTNSFNYKGIGLNFLIDAKFGGQVYSGTNAQAYFNGRHKETLKGREDGLVVTGVDTDGNPLNVVVEPRNIPSYNQYFWDKIAEEFIYDTDFIKFRELSLSYSFPKDLIGEDFIKDLRISLIGRNLFYIMKDVDNIDPEASLNNTNAQGLERFGVPSTKSYGFSVNVKF
ncbi:MAG: SusC/RagA family TonB-linked outer membrane protein, partial [Bacteroidota bacterium]